MVILVMVAGVEFLGDCGGTGEGVSLSEGLDTGIEGFLNTPQACSSMTFTSVAK